MMQILTPALNLLKRLTKDLTNTSTSFGKSSIFKSERKRRYNCSQTDSFTEIASKLV